MRRQAAVHAGDVGTTAGTSSLGGDHSVITVLGYDQVIEVLRDGVTYTTDIFNELMEPALGRVILGMDPEEHRSHRALVQQAFSRREMALWETDLHRTGRQPATSTGSRAPDEAELVRDLTFLFPVFVIAAHPRPARGGPQRLPFVVRRDDLLPLRSPRSGWRGSRSSRSTSSPLVGEQRRVNPQHDVISMLAKAELNGHTLNDEEIVSFLRFLLEAGAETTYRSSSNLFYALLSNPEVLDGVARIGRCYRRPLMRRSAGSRRWQGDVPGRGDRHRARRSGGAEGCVHRA